jgi:hypothetical protein
MREMRDVARDGGVSILLRGTSCRDSGVEGAEEGNVGGGGRCTGKVCL